MTPVYSGGLVYEYSQEPTDYGLVEIKSNKVSELPDFAKFRDALAKSPVPRGDGGYSAAGKPSQCPPKSDTWEVEDGGALPALPEGARQYLQKGAGKGPGLSGDGSQEAGPDTHETASAGSGRVTGAASASRSGNAAAGSVYHGGMVGNAVVGFGVVVAVTSFLGAALL